MSNMMKALVKAKAEPGLWMEHVPVPEPGANDVLIRVKKSAICGTDVHIWDWNEWAAATIPVPMVVGHEFCGEITEIGSAAIKANAFPVKIALIDPPATINPGMTAEVSLVLEEQLRERIDQYRREQDDLPSRSEAIRRLVEKSLKE